MTSNIDMSLDDIVRMNRKNRQETKKGNTGFRQGGIGAVGGKMSRSFGKAQRTRSDRPRFSQRAEGATGIGAGDRWAHDRFAQQQGRSVTYRDVDRPYVDENAKVIIDNLHFDIVQEDLVELFSTVGRVKRAMIHYDRSGRSLGTAEVVFVRRVDAMKAITKFHGQVLEGHQISLTLSSPSLRKVIPPARTVVSHRGFRGTRRGRFPGRRGRAGPQNRKTAEELDAEMQQYMNATSTDVPSGASLLSMDVAME